MENTIHHNLISFYGLNVSNNVSEARLMQMSDKKIFRIIPRILLVEDIPIIQFVHTKLLELFGCEVEVANNGLEARNMFKNGYDLIFLDIGLPQMSGIEVARRIREYEMVMNAQPNTLIALTAFGEAVLEECMSAGCNDFYTKPLALNQLEQLFIRWLPNHIKMEVKSSSH